MEPDNIGRPKKDTGLWTRIENRIYDSELYQIFVVRALKNQWSKITYWYLLVSLISVVANIGFFNPIYHLEEMNTLEGTFIKWTRPKHGNRIFIKAEDGNIFQFFVTALSSELEKKLNSIKGEKVKCYFQHEYRFNLPCVRDRLWEIDYKEEKIYNYDYKFQYLGSMSGRTDAVISLVVSIVFLMAVYYQNKNRIDLGGKG